MRTANNRRPLAAAVLASVATGAFANDTFANDTSNDTIEEVQVYGSRLDEATTATGLPLTIRQTPQSVSIVDAGFMQDYALNTVADVMALAPGIQAQQAETGRYFFRARGNNVTNFQFDGLPVQYDSFFSEAVSDTVMYERIEIVRGATGLLSGAGEPSAAINMIRKRPTGDNSGYLDVTGGRWDRYRLEGDASFNIDDAGRYQLRLAGSREQGDSYVNLASEDNTVLYGVFTAELGGSTLLTLGADYNEQNPEGSTWGALPLFYADGGQADDISRSTTTAAEWSAWNREGENIWASLEHEFNNGWDLRLEAEHRKDEMDGYLLYMSGSPDRVTGEGMRASLNNYRSIRRQEAARLYVSGPFSLFGREHHFTSGLLYSEQEVDSRSRRPADPVSVGNFWEWDGSLPEPAWSVVGPKLRNTTTQTGAYAAFQLSLHERLTAILGNRVSRYEVEDSFGGGYEQDDINTPYAGLVFDLTDAISAYGSYTEIFQPQNARDHNRQLLDPIVGDNIEAGIKGDFFDQRLTASIAVFETEKDNVAEADPNYPDPLPDGGFPQRGVKGARNQGYELEITGQPSDNWTVAFSWTSNESEQADGSAFKTFLPENMAKLSSRYTFGGALDDLVIGGNLIWQDDVYNEGVGPGGATARQDSYYVVNLMGGYRFTDKLSARLNVKNALDEKYYSSIDFYNQGFFGEPRNVELNLRYDY